MKRILLLLALLMPASSCCLMEGPAVEKTVGQLLSAMQSSLSGMRTDLDASEYADVPMLQTALERAESSWGQPTVYRELVASWPIIREYYELYVDDELSAGRIGPNGVASLRERLVRFDEALGALGALQ